MIHVFDQCIVPLQLATPEPRMVKVVPRPNFVTVVIEKQMRFLSLHNIIFYGRDQRDMHITRGRQP